jgi:hypothetical protein
MEAVRRLGARFVAAARQAPVTPGGMGGAAVQDTIAIVDGIRTRAVQSCLARAGDGLMGGAPKSLIGTRGSEMARGGASDARPRAGLVTKADRVIRHRVVGETAGAQILFTGRTRRGRLAAR